MKKLIGTVVVAALLATTAFAEGISFGSWGRGLFAVGNAKAASNDKNEVTSWVGQSWGFDAPRTALNVRGNSENVGFALDIHGNAKTLGMGDNALIWVKPIEMLKITLAAKDDTNLLRSDAAYGLWNWDRIGCVDGNGEGFIFPALLNKNLSVVATPIEGLTIGAGFDSHVAGEFAGKKISDGIVDGNRLVDQIGRSLGVAAAYTIADIGTIKAGLSTHGKGVNKDGEKKDLIKIHAAFELAAVENVYVAVGATIPVGGTYTSETAGVGNTNPISISAYGKLSMIENLAIHLIAGLKLNSADGKTGDAKADGAFGFMFGAGIDYALSNGIGLFADVRYANGIYYKTSSDDKKDTLTLGAGLTKGFSNGLIGVAFEASTNGYGRPAIYDNAMAWEVPVKFEYWF